MKTIIHVDQHALARNRKTGSRDAPITVKNYKSNQRAHEVLVTGPCVIRYAPDAPLACGASVWIETCAAVVILGDPS
jgi:hypothetical protein